MMSSTALARRRALRDVTHWLDEPNTSDQPQSTKPDFGKLDQVLREMDSELALIQDLRDRWYLVADDEVTKIADRFTTNGLDSWDF